MKASEVNDMIMIRDALSGIPGQGASMVSDISFRGGRSLGYDCGIPADPYATDVSQGGERVLIGDINKILQLIGTGLYMRQRGGSNEFDERVVEIDKGAKTDGDWGYPNGAIIDWWDGSTFRKVMCIKSGEGIENGNCTVGPDDPEHGVEGSGIRYWELVGIPSQDRFLGYSNVEPSQVAQVSGTASHPVYVFTRFARITVAFSATVSSYDFAGSSTYYNTIVFFMKKGDRLEIDYSSSSMSINGKTFSPGIGSISTNATLSNFGIHLVHVEKTLWQPANT